MKLPVHDKKFLFLLFAVGFAIVMEILSLTGIEIPMPYAPFIYGIFIIGIGYSVLWNGLKALFRLQFSSINLLMLIAVIGAYYLREYPEAAVVIVLYVLGERLEDIGIENSKSALDQLVSNTPKTALVKLTQTDVPVEDIPVGTIIQIKPGDLIPLDGKLVFGETTVDESAITGEPLFQDKNIDDILYAGTLNKNGYIEIETTKKSTETTFSKIIQLTYEASANKSDTQKFIQRFSKYYTPSVIIAALLLFVIPVFILHLDMQEWLHQAIALLVIACPCALVISTPVAIYAAIGNASKKGILIKGGKYVETIGICNAIALDKTRTLTYGKPIVSDIILLNNTSYEELLACTAGVEIFSEHPLAQAIVEKSIQEGYEPHKMENFQSYAGQGVTAKCIVCDDEEVLLGKLSFIKEKIEVTEEVEKTVENLSAEGKTSVVICFNNKVGGIIGLSDEIKSEAKDVITELKALGLEPVMLSGDNQRAASYIGNQVGIQKVYGGLLPDEKASKIKSLLEEYSHTAMVGDGINDAPALALSSVGIAMGAAGSDTAFETANIALMNDKLSLIPYLIRLSRKTMKRIKTNVLIALLVKLVFIVLAFLGYSHLVLAITADVGVTLLVIVLSLRLMNYK